MAKRLLKNALDLFAGRADYGDVRLVNRVDQQISVRNSIVEGLEERESYGVGIRVLVKGAWGFAATNEVTKQGIEKSAKRAIEVAQASASVNKKKVKLTPIKVIKNGQYQTPYKIDPFNVSYEDKIKVLLKADELICQQKQIKVAQSFCRCFKEEKTFVSTEGSFITQEILVTGGGIEATAVGNDDVQNRSHPNSHQGQFQTGGWEMLEELDLPGNASRVAEEAVALLTAKQCPEREWDIILDGPQMALQVHESCGHPTELDRVLGFEASYAGTSFMTLDGLGRLRYGSDIVNITADATLAGGLGTFGFDDEGVPSQRFYLIKDGLHLGYLTSRETAAFVGLRASNGTMRADGWQNMPLIRMTNINLEPGDPSAGSGQAWQLDDLIANTKRGILMSINKAWSIDDKRINFQFGCELGWEIKNGKKFRLLKNPSYTGITPHFWQSCDAIANKNYWQIWGVPNCGKGEPSQIMYVGHGVAPARFRKVRVGTFKLT